MQYIIILDTTHKKLCMAGVHLDPPQVGQPEGPTKMRNITPTSLMAVVDAIEKCEWDYVDMLCDDAVEGFHE
jgi:hypothetical protein